MTNENNQGPGGGDQGSGGGQGHGGGNPGHGGGGDEGPEHGGKVRIIVDDEPFEVRKGEWIVRDLKTEAHVDPAKVLSEITPQGLKDLDDAARIEVREGMRFMSHARSGGSS